MHQRLTVGIFYRCGGHALEGLVRLKIVDVVGFWGFGNGSAAHGPKVWLENLYNSWFTGKDKPLFGPHFFNLIPLDCFKTLKIENSHVNLH